MENKLFADKERACQLFFEKKGPLWHMATPGEYQEIIFTCDDDFRFSMTLVADCAWLFPDVEIATYEIMSNHIHLLAWGKRERCQAMFDYFKIRLSRYHKSKERVVDLSRFDCSFFIVEDLNAARNNITYINRNGYVAQSNKTPYSYPWGSNYLYFNGLIPYLENTPYNSLGGREKRKITYSRTREFPSNYFIRNGHIAPECFCYYKEGEKLFRNAHHYFNLLSKNYEAYSQIASTLQDRIMLADEEMYSAVCQICSSRFNVSAPSLLKAEERIEVARLMKKGYNASNSQIKRILKLTDYIINELFPIPK